MHCLNPKKTHENKGPYFASADDSTLAMSGNSATTTEAVVEESAAIANICYKEHCWEIVVSRV